MADVPNELRALVELLPDLRRCEAVIALGSFKGRVASEVAGATRFLSSLIEGVEGLIQAAPDGERLLQAVDAES